MQSLLTLVVAAATWAVSSGLHLYANFDNIGWVQFFPDGLTADYEDTAVSQIIYAPSWPTTHEYEIPDEDVTENAVFRFTCQDKGVVGGVIALIEYQGVNYYTDSNEDGTIKAPFSVESTYDSLVFTPYGTGAWRTRIGTTYPGTLAGEVPQWVWDGQLHNTMVFRFSLADIAGPALDCIEGTSVSVTESSVVQIDFTLEIGSNFANDGWLRVLGIGAEQNGILVAYPSVWIGDGVFMVTYAADDNFFWNFYPEVPAVAAGTTYDISIEFTPTQLTFAANDVSDMTATFPRIPLSAAQNIEWSDSDDSVTITNQCITVQNES